MSSPEKGKRICFGFEKKGFFVTELKFPQKENSKSLNITAAPQENPAKEFLADFTSNSPAVEKFPFTLWSHTMRQILTSQDEKLLQRHSVKGVMNCVRQFPFI